jgi:outer membrane lipoprotein-sorting protein
MLRTVALGLALVAAAGAAGCRSHDGSGGLPPFYLEATLEMDDASSSVGTNVAGASSPLVTEHRVTRIRWLQLNRDEYRLELESIEPASDAGTDLIVLDGHEQFYYRHETHTYTRSPLFEVPEGTVLRVRPWSFGALIGPWYGEAASIDDLLQELRNTSNNSSEARVVGSETVVGRKTTIVEVSPAYISSSSSGDDTGHGTVKYWVDPDRMVILRQELDDRPVQRFSIEVTRFDWNPDDRGPVKFTPPPGAALQGPENSPSAAITPSGRASP